MLQQYYKDSEDIDFEKNISYYIHKQENKTKNTKEGEENTNVKQRKIKCKCCKGRCPQRPANKQNNKIRL